MSEPSSARHRSSMTPSRMTRGQRWLFWLTLALCTTSGATWLLAQSVFAIDEGFGPAPHPSAAWALRVHGVSAYLLMAVTGSLWPLHMRLNWRSGINRRSGLWMLVVFCALAVTGLWLYYGSDSGRHLVATLHWAIGLGVPLLAWLHRRLGQSSGR
jgi:hypothetical protein